MEYPDPKRKSNFIGKILLAATLTALCIIMLKQSQSFSAPSRVPTWFYLYFFYFPLFYAILMLKCSKTLIMEATICSLYHIQKWGIVVLWLYILLGFHQQLLQDPMSFSSRIIPCMLSLPAEGLA